MQEPNYSSWYQSLKKPSWAPKEFVFGQVWSLLYPIIFGVNFYVLVMLSQKRITLSAALPFWINLALNFLYTPVQFGYRNQLLSSIVIIGVWATVLWAQIAIWPYSKVVALLYVPYLLWVSIATVLQLSIYFYNR